MSLHPEPGFAPRPWHGGPSQPRPTPGSAPGRPGQCREPWPTPSSPLPARSTFTIFQGGMPRASYGDRHCISVVHDGQQTAFDFTSRIIDFTVLVEADPAGRHSEQVGRAEWWGGPRPPSVNKRKGLRIPKPPHSEPLCPITPLLMPSGCSLACLPRWPHPPPTPSSLCPSPAQISLSLKGADPCRWV